MVIVSTVLGETAQAIIVLPVVMQRQALADGIARYLENSGHTGNKKSGHCRNYSARTIEMAHCQDNCGRKASPGERLCQLHSERQAQRM
jgi:hypothetical protein